MRKPPAAILLSLVIAAAARAEFPISAPGVSPAVGVQSSPAIASNGFDAVAAWEDRRGGQADVYASLVRDIGRPSAGVEKSLTAVRNDELHPAVVWNGSTYVIAHYIHDEGVRLTRFEDGTSRMLTQSQYGRTGTAGLSEIALAWNGRNYLLIVVGVDSGNGTLYGVLLDPNFNVTQRMQISPSGRNAGEPSIATDGESFVVAWRDRNVEQYEQLSLARVGAAGDVTRLGPLHSSLTPLSRPRIVWSDDDYLVVWSDGEVRAQFLDRQGMTIGQSIVVFRAGSSPNVAWNGVTFYIPFSVPGLGLDLYGVRLGANGTLLDAHPVPVSTAPFDQSEVAVTVMSGRFVVAWRSGDDVVTAFVSDYNGRSSQHAILAQSLGNQTQTRGIFDGDLFVFVWIEEGEVRFGRVTRDGRPFDGAGRFLAGGGRNPRIAFNGEKFLAVWESTAPFNRGKAELRVLAIDGSPIADVPTTLPFDNPQAVATDGRNFLIVVSERTQTKQRLRGVLVSPAGEWFALPPFVPSEFDQVDAQLAFDGSAYVLVYDQLVGPGADAPRETRSVVLDRFGIASPESTVVHGAPRPFLLAAADGVAMLAGVSGSSVRVVRLGGGPVDVARCTGGCAIHDIVWTGADFLIAFDGRAVRVAPDGQVRGEAGLTFAYDQGVPRLVAIDERSFAAVYDRPVPDLIARRAFFTIVHPGRRRGVR